ncbi:MAG: phosphodiester glycosidase family protein [Phyllobacterium sp.]|uniref:phosphodiester glycosidase family protein n=1 Tax=Phyllobacterium sp. TaxID=1871046 RepID=UPI0030F1ED21
MYSLSFASGDLPTPCRFVTFESSGNIVCEIDLRSFDIRLALNGHDDKPFGSLASFIAAQPPSTGLVLAMNAGMYEPDMTPVGRYVEDGRTIAPLNTRDGEGNFYMKPNGVFFIRLDGTPGVLPTEAYANSATDVRMATQSGPMLVIDGKVHPRFEPNGTSRFIRNGVGVRDANTIVLAISTEPVSLGRFARLFRDELACANALFFDGMISALSNDRKVLIGGTDPVGPILAVYKRP